MSIYFTLRRIEHLREMKFVTEYGYSYKWAKRERVMANSGGNREDPRIKRDA